MTALDLVKDLIAFDTTSRDSNLALIDYAQGLLEKAGALKSRRKTVAGRSRVYYSLTVKGARRLSTLTSRWSDLNGAVQALMGGALAVR